MQPEIAATKRGRDSRVAGSHSEVRTSRALHMTVVLTALPTPLPELEAVVLWEVMAGGSAGGADDWCRGW